MGKDFPGRGAAPAYRVSSGQAVQPPETARPAHPKATKTPQPRSRHTAEMRRAPKYGSHYVSPYSCECLPWLSPRPHHAGSACCRALLGGHCAPCKAVCPSALQVLPCGRRRVLRGLVALCHRWQQDSKHLSRPGGNEMAWGSREGAATPGLCCLASENWWGGGHTAPAAAHCSGVTPQVIKMLPPLLPLLRGPWACGGTWGILGDFATTA